MRLMSSTAAAGDLVRVCAGGDDAEAASEHVSSRTLTVALQPVLGPAALSSFTAMDSLLRLLTEPGTLSRGGSSRWSSWATRRASRGLFIEELGGC